MSMAIAHVLVWPACQLRAAFSHRQIVLSHWYPPLSHFWEAAQINKTSSHTISSFRFLYQVDLYSQSEVLGLWFLLSCGIYCFIHSTRGLKACSSCYECPYSCMPFFSTRTVCLGPLLENLFFPSIFVRCRLSGGFDDHSWTELNFSLFFFFSFFAPACPLRFLRVRGLGQYFTLLVCRYVASAQLLLGYQVFSPEE